MEPTPTRTIEKPGAIRALEEKLRESLAHAVGLSFATFETDASAVWLRGREKHTGENVSAFYFGSGRSLDHLVDKLYDSHEVSRRRDGLRIWSAPRYLREARASVDICFADLPWPYSRLCARRGFLHIPGWIVQKIPLTDSWDGVVAQFRKNTKTTDLRKVRKYQLRFTLSRAPADLDYFYERLYAPYAQHRFKHLAIIDDHDNVCGLGNRRVLLQVVHDRRVVAGVVLHRWRRTMHFLWFGILLDVEQGVADAALSAIYLFSIQHAYNEGCVELNLSFTIPLLNDGVYRYKRKWGARVHDAWRLGDIVASPVSFGPAIRSFFANQPMIMRDEGRLTGKILLDQPADQEALAKLAEGYASPGLNALKFFCLDARTTAAARECIDVGMPVSCCDLSGSNDPAADFCRL